MSECSHPHDYLLIEAAARRRGFSLPEFIELAACQGAREISSLRICPKFARCSEIFADEC
jgi:hypothetical protein